MAYCTVCLCVVQTLVDKSQWMCTCRTNVAYLVTICKQLDSFLQLLNVAPKVLSLSPHAEPSRIRNHWQFALRWLREVFLAVADIPSATSCTMETSGSEQQLSLHHRPEGRCDGSHQGQVTRRRCGRHRSRAGPGRGRGTKTKASPAPRLFRLTPAVSLRSSVLCPLMTVNC